MHRALLSLLLAASALPSPALTPVGIPPPAVPLALDPLPWDQGASGLGLALRHLGTTGRVLYVTAHPDDEDNALLVALSRGHGLQVTVLTLTRGEGGLNEVGPELYQELSVLRTEETRAVHRHDGVRQLFGRAADFGYSYSVEECLARWGREQTLADVVAVVRHVRPDVMITMPRQDAGGGAAHSASAQLAAEAFRAAADLSRFPEHSSAGLQPWQTRKLYEAGVGGGEAPGGTLSLDLSAPDPLLGMGWAELGSVARSFHRTQGTLQVKRPAGEGHSRLRLALSEPPVEGAEGFVLDGIETSVERLSERFGGPASPDLRAAQSAAETARDRFDARRPSATLPALVEGLQAVRAALDAARHLSAARGPEMVDRLEEEEADFARAIALAAEMAVEPTLDTPDLQPGGTYTVTTRVRQSATLSVRDVTLRLPEGWSLAQPDDSGTWSAPAGLRVKRHVVTVPPEAAPTQPAWRVDPRADRHRVLDVEEPYLDWSEPLMAAVVHVSTAAGPVNFLMPVYARQAGPVGGEQRTPARVAPPLSLRVSPAVVPFPIRARAPREVRVTVAALAEGPGAARVALEAPPGWRVAPALAEVSWSHAGEEAAARFSVTPPAAATAGVAELKAVATLGQRAFRDTWTIAAKAHVTPRPVVQPALARALLLDLRPLPGVRVGYLGGTGDVGAEALRALGLAVRVLSPGDLDGGDLSGLSTIVLGVRAYHAHPELRARNGRLLDFARKGGHVVVQLSRAEFNQTAPLLAGSAPPARGASPFAPYPARVGTQRVADETAALRLLLPAHPLVSRPHGLGEADFAGWVQERGSFLLEAQDARYRELLAAADPWPQNAGEKKGLLTEAPVGRGSWTYVGLNLFRQLSVGTPGAYRLLANLVARPRGQGR